MKERPILFSAPMVRAILEGKKTQTRRIIKRQPVGEFCDYKSSLGYPASEGTLWAGFGRKEDPCYHKCSFGQPGDRLWVRETHWINTGDIRVPSVVYAADPAIGIFPWRPSIHMPRWASRITLEITGIRVERLQDISEDDAKAEGIEGRWHPDDPQIWTWRDYTTPGRFCYGSLVTPRSTYESLWESINGQGSWAQNPWVWVIEFKRL